MKQRRFVFSKSVANKWMISYAVIMLIPLVISAIIYVQTKQIVEYEIKRASQAMLKQVKYMVDSEVSQTEKLAMQLSINSDVSRFVNLSQSLEPNEAFSIYQIRQELGKLKSTNDFINGIYVYSDKLDKVLTDETYTTSQMFYDMNSRQFADHYEDWLATVRNAAAGEQQLNTITFERSGDTVFLIKSLGTSSVNHASRSSLLFPLNTSAVQKMLDNVDWVNKGEVYILDEQDNLLFQNNKNTNEPVFVNTIGEGDKTGSSFVNIGGMESMVSFVTSDTSEWRYISVFPSTVFWEKARELRNMNLLGLLACFLVGGAVIYYFARRNYNPVRELVNVFSLFGGKKEDQSVLDEFSFIRENALAALKERDDMNSKQHRQLRVIQAYYLSRMLKGQTEGSGSTLEVAALYHLDWTSENFAVLLFYIEPREEASLSADLSNFIVSNIIEDNVAGLHSLSFTDMDGLLTAILNINPQRVDMWKEDMEDALAKTLEFIEQRYGLQIVMAGSELQLGLAGMHQAYLQALDAQEYRLLLEENVSIWYADIEPTSEDYYLTINDELAFINVVKTGELTKAAELMDEILHHIFSNQSSIEMLKYTMIDLASSIMKSAPQEANEDQQGDKWRPLKYLLACTTKADFRKELMLILAITCTRINDRKSLLSSPGIAEQVSDYVERSYMDQNLSVSLIGAEFGINAQYVSRLFKEQTGQGLYDYINRTRIEKAKLLLVQDSNIEETSRQTGFTSSNAFIRVFKRYEGITPGKYRGIQ